MAVRNIYIKMVVDEKDFEDITNETVLEKVLGEADLKYEVTFKVINLKRRVRRLYVEAVSLIGVHNPRSRQAVEKFEAIYDKFIEEIES